MYRILFFILCFPVIMKSQSIVWEVSQKVDNFPINNNFSFFIDSDGNPVILLDGTADEFLPSSLIKYDTFGNILSFKQYSSKERRYPVSFYETDVGYRLFGLADSSIFDFPYTISLPYIINTDINGNIISSIEPYNLKLTANYKKYGTKLYSLKTSSLTVNHNFYNAYIENNVEIDSTHFKVKNHLILSSYDSLGNYLWRKGYDTLKSGTDKSFIRNFRISKTNTILTVVQFSKWVNGIYEYSCKIIEIDLEGNLLKNIMYSPINESVVPVDIAGLEDGSVIVLAYYIDSTIKNHILVKLNNNGEVIKKIVIQESGPKKNFEGMSLSPSGDIVIYGSSFVDSKVPTTKDDDLYKMCLIKFNKNFEFEWEYLWHEYTNDKRSSIKNIEFLDDNNIIAVGYENIFDIFCAKISLLPTSIDENIIDNNNFSIYPNPATNFIDIKLNNGASLIASGKVQIFDILGIEVGQSSLIVNYMSNNVNDSQAGMPNLLRIDISHLPGGVYYIRISCSNGACSIVNKFEKFVKM